MAAAQELTFACLAHPTELVMFFGLFFIVLGNHISGERQELSLLPQALSCNSLMSRKPRAPSCPISYNERPTGRHAAHMSLELAGCRALIWPAQRNSLPILCIFCIPARNPCLVLLRQMGDNDLVCVMTRS